jgi:hypothetical protein
MAFDATFGADEFIFAASAAFKTEIELSVFSIAKIQYT